MSENGKQLNNYLGAVHIHSGFSDGSGDIGAIVSAAKDAGLDWIIITDHNNLEIEEGFIDGVCVIKGLEISPDNGNHYLAFGVNKLIEPNCPPDVFVNEVRKQKGFGFAAHPDESDKRKNGHLPLKWQDKKIIPDGIEIWNWFSNWADNYNAKNIFTKAFSYLFKDRLITKPQEETLLWWDELNKKTKNIVPALGGVDAHALIIKDYIIPITVFPYKSMFKTITNVIYTDKKLPDDFEKAKELILTSIKEGKNLIVNRTISKDIPLINISNSNKIAYCGEKIKLDKDTFFKIKLKKYFKLKLFQDGRKIFEKIAKECAVPLFKSGKYRAEIVLNNCGYTYSNPIMVV